MRTTNAISALNLSDLSKLAPFGKDVAYSEDDIVRESYLLNFTNKEIDYNLDLHYFGARYYTADFPRFISPDPVSGKLETPITWNRYLYCRNDPINYIDPDGEDAITSNEQFQEWAFYEIFKEGGFGFSKKEHAFWIRRIASDQVMIMKWPSSGMDNKAEWKGPIPSGTLGQGHNHSIDVGQKPDNAADRKLGDDEVIKVYTIVRSGIHSYNPKTGDIVHEETSEIWKKFDPKADTRFPSSILIMIPENELDAYETSIK